MRITFASPAATGDGIFLNLIPSCDGCVTNVPHDSSLEITSVTFGGLDEHTHD